MNPIMKFLFYKTYEDRISKLRIISVMWFILWFIFFKLSDSILAGLIGGLLFTVPLFSIGLIIRIIFIDDKDSNKTDEVKINNEKIKITDSNKKEIKTIISNNKKSTNAQREYLEKDNIGTRHDTVDKANGYWWGERLNKPEKDPFTLYRFKSGKAAEEALLELPFIHKATDTGNLICDDVYIFGYYHTSGDYYEAIVCGKNLTYDEFKQAEEAFEKHDGSRVNNLEPDKSAKKVKTNTKNVGSSVKFREKFNKDQFTYECYDGKTKADAMEFLKDKEVTKSLYYICVYTPEGDFGRDINGIYEM